MTAIAFYLPQFHQIPENDDWWGIGHTDWVGLRTYDATLSNVPLRKPTEPLGWYSLLDGGVLELQASLAKAYGIAGFAVWTYWFGAREQLLEKPIELALKERRKFPYLIAWANHDWEAKPDGRVLKRQQYLGRTDYVSYFKWCRRHFESDFYLTQNGRPLFYLYNPARIPDLEIFVDTFRECAIKAGLPLPYLIGDLDSIDSEAKRHLDGYSLYRGFWKTWRAFKPSSGIPRGNLDPQLHNLPVHLDYDTVMAKSFAMDATNAFIPTVVAGWNSIPRHGRNGLAFEGFTKEAFARHLNDALQCLCRRENTQQMVLIKSWNEWGEQNVLEPDSIFGFDLLQEFSDFAKRLQSRNKD